MRRGLLAALVVAGCHSAQGVPPSNTPPPHPPPKPVSGVAGDQVASVETSSGSSNASRVAEDGAIALRDQRASARNARHGLVCSESATGHGCVDAEGTVVIPFVHEHPVEFSASGFALCMISDEGWFYVDTSYGRRLKAMTVEGMPDEIYLQVSGRTGFVRFREDGKLGYLDPERGVVIPARYDNGYLFDGGKALVCVGCHPMRWSAAELPEAMCTGEAFIIDEQGRRLDEEPALWDCQRVEAEPEHP